MYRHFRIAIAFGLTGLAACSNIGAPSMQQSLQAGSPASATKSARPNILFIMADDLGYSDIGAFGAEISTPNLDALAASGRILTNYRTGATCSPTRAMLLSGTDHHRAGLGSMAETLGALIANNVGPFGKGKQYGVGSLPEGYVGYLNDQVLSLPQLLQDAGYHTYMAGKWHLASVPTETIGRWNFRPESFPKAKGFERSFALLNGGASHYSPVPSKPTPIDAWGKYIENDQPATIPHNFYSSDFYTDKLISYIDANKKDGRPFFAYAAYTAPHNPLHAPDADIQRYKGKFDEGYEAVRERRLAKQKALGLLPAGSQASPGLDSSIGRPRWADLTPEQRATEARKMEIYAAMVENMDRNIGRLVQHLKDIGEFDNTLIVFTSDNGADGSAMHLPMNPNIDNSLTNLGRPLSAATYGERWAEVSATPFRLWKGLPTEGGIAAPMIVRLPGQMVASAPSAALAHVTDLLPTFLEAAGVAVPVGNYRGKPVHAISGMSLMPHWKGGDAPANRVLSDELFTGRYVISGQWKLLAVQRPFGESKWELYDLNNDRGETQNLIDHEPEVAAHLIKEYQAYAARNGVIDAPMTLPRGPMP